MKTENIAKSDFYESFPADPVRPYIHHPTSKEMSCPSQWHENIELLLFHSKSRVICDRSEYDVEAGDITVFGSNSLHSVPKFAGTVYDCLIVDCSFCSYNSLDVMHLAFDCVVRDETATMLYKKAIDAIDRANSELPFAPAEAKSALLELLVHICKGWSHPKSSKQTGGIVRKAIGYINSHLTRQMSVDEIADSVKVSKYYFCREFRRETGYTVVKYINTVRCREAERMLRSGSFTVSEVARACGFDNLSYFTRTFKTITGRTPSELLRD